mmetsp:Transcript_3889/g.10823  ORF Transcript_3889/g.10823 Transcript_3889/m.10823 type:complete len:156 (-) Transcript_3889:1014-1481(-)
MDHKTAKEELKAFTRTKPITPQLTKVLEELATSGRSRFEWVQLKALIGAKMIQVCNEYNGGQPDVGGEGFDSVLMRLLALLDEFSETPFTAQRLCELLLDPRKIYATSTRKLMNALEKLLTVSSTMPVMVMAPAKEGSYQEATENELVSARGWNA